MSDPGGGAVGDTQLAASDEATPAGDDVVRGHRRSSRPSGLALVLAALLLAVVAQLVISWLLLGATLQVRDQATIANARQRCIVQAQLGQSTTTDPGGAGTRAAIQSCLNR